MDLRGATGTGSLNPVLSALLLVLVVRFCLVEAFDALVICFVLAKGAGVSNRRAVDARVVVRRVGRLISGSTSAVSTLERLIEGAAPFPCLM